MIEEEVYRVLSTALVTDSIYPHRLPEGSVKFPAVVIYGAGGVPIDAQDAYVRVVIVRCDVWAQTFDEVVNTARDVRSVLARYNSGSMSSVYRGELDIDDPDTGMFRRTLEFVMQEP